MLWLESRNGLLWQPCWVTERCTTPPATSWGWQSSQNSWGGWVVSLLRTDWQRLHQSYFMLWKTLCIIWNFKKNYWETVWQFLKRWQIDFPHDPAIPLKAYEKRDLTTCDHTESSYTNVHSAFVHSSQKVEATPMPMDGWVDRQSVAHLYSGKLFSHEKDQSTDTCYNTDEYRYML